MSDFKKYHKRKTFHLPRSEKNLGDILKGLSFSNFNNAKILPLQQKAYCNNTIIKFL